MHLALAFVIGLGMPVSNVPRLGELSTVLHDVDEHGQLFAAGANWKMRFSPSGARYVPLLGPHAPRSLPIDFLVAGAVDVPPVRVGDRVTFDRGAMVEVYDLDVDQVEQSFVLRERPATDTLRIELATELDYIGRDAEGLSFKAAEFATVRYGNAVAIDADGRRSTMAPEFADGAITIRLPREFLADARWPVVVDPVIKTFQIGQSESIVHADVAYSDLNNLFQVSFERIVSGSDSDIHVRRYDVHGNPLETLGLDLSEEDSEKPAVAFDAPHFMTIWRDSDSGPGGLRIRARARVAGSTAVASVLTVSPLSHVSEGNPTIGGGGTNGRFLAVWTAQSLPTDFVATVKCRALTAGGTAGGVTALGVAALSANVSKRADSAGRFAIAYMTKETFIGTQREFRVALADCDGNVSPSSPLLTKLDGDSDTSLNVIHDGTRFVVVYPKENPTSGRDVQLRTLVPTGATLGFTLGNQINLSQLAFGADDQLSQSLPSLGFDGVRFVVFYLEASTYFAMTFQLGQALMTPTVSFQETHDVVASEFGGDFQLATRSASCGLDQPGKHFLVYDIFDIGSEDGVIKGALYSSLGPGGTSILETGCGGTSEPAVVSVGVPALGNTVTILLIGFNEPFVALGPKVVAPGCSFSTCQLGVNGTSYLPHVGSIFSFSVGTSPVLLGLEFAFQGIDRAPPPGAGPHCVLPHGQEFTASDTLVFTIQ